MRASIPGRRRSPLGLRVQRLRTLARALAATLPLSLLPIAAPVTAQPPGARAASDGPRLGEFWRSVFARPATPAPAPADNPSTPEKIALGQKLFTSTDLSADNGRACVSCHDPARAFTDGRARALARDGSDLTRNAPMLLDLGWSRQLMWDGRAASLEAQAAMPIEDARELAGSWGDIVARIKRQPELDVAFHVAFRDRPATQPTSITHALAAYVRSLVSPETRFDRWVAGDDGALSPEEMAGFALFVGKAGCVACHGGWRFTDDKFHDIGLPGDDPGRGAVPGGVKGLAAFKTPSLRELTLTAPYMHDGSKATLRAVVDHYAGNVAAPPGLLARPSLDSAIVRDLRLDEHEKAALIAFLLALSSQPPGATPPADEQRPAGDVSEGAHATRPRPTAQ